MCHEHTAGMPPRLQQVGKGLHDVMWRNEGVRSLFEVKHMHHNTAEAPLSDLTSV